MLKIALIFFSILLFTACQQAQTGTDKASSANTADVTSKQDRMSTLREKEIQIVEKMQWLLSANAESDALASLDRVKTKQKPELIAFSNRMINFPGLTIEQYEVIKNKVDYIIPAGSGDMLLGEEHHEMQKKLFAYAERYNAVVFEGLSTQ